MATYTRDQVRARNAAAFVRAIAEAHPDLPNAPSKVRKRYNTVVHKLPVLIRTNGLLLTAAFLESKAGEDGEKLGTKLAVQHLQRHLEGAELDIPAGRLLSERLAGLDAERYLIVQEEAVMCAGWQKRFAAAVFGEAAT